MRGLRGREGDLGHAAKGKGSCTLGAKTLKPGNYQLSGVYSGDRTYGGSAYPDETLGVTK